MFLVVLAIKRVSLDITTDHHHNLIIQLSIDNGRSREGMKSHMLSRNQKLKSQGAEAQTGVFKGVRA